MRDLILRDKGGASSKTRGRGEAYRRPVAGRFGRRLYGGRRTTLRDDNGYVDVVRRGQASGNIGAMTMATWTVGSDGSEGHQALQ